MAKKNYKLAKGQYVSSVLNPGLDKSMPIGSVDVVYNADGSMAGFLRGQTFYNPGEKVPESKKASAPKINATEGSSLKEKTDQANLKGQLDIQNNLAQQASNDMSGYRIDTPEYADAKKRYESAQKKIQEFQPKYDALTQQIAAKEASASTAKQANKATSDAQQAQAKADELAARAADQPSNPDLQKQAQDAKVAADKLKTTQGPVGTNTGLTPAPFGGMQNEQGAVQNVKGTAPAPVTSKPVSTGTSGTNTSSGTSGGGQYSSKGGVLSYNGQPFSGQYQGKFYSQGKLETPDQVKQDFLANYGVQAALVASDPELSALLTKAIANNYSPARWGVEFQNTQWAKSRTAAQQLSETQRLSKPVMYAESYNNARQRAITLANSLGFDLTETQMGAPIDPAAAQTVHTKDATGQNLAEWIVANNPTDQALQAHLAQVGKINTTLIGGQVQTYAQQLKQQAMNLGLSNYMLPNNTNGDFFTQSAKGIISGTTSLQEQQQYLINEAKKIFPAYAKQLDAGISVTSLAAPYINSLTNLLETTPDQVDLSQQSGYGAMITKALQGNNDPNNPVPMDLGTFANQVRALPQWMNTSNAKTTIMDSGTQFLKSMGLIR